MIRTCPAEDEDVTFCGSGDALQFIRREIPNRVIISGTGFCRYSIVTGYGRPAEVSSATRLEKFLQPRVSSVAT